jgi:hypothetical protein
MARLREHKTSFTSGEVSAWLLGRHDLRAYQNGARRLRNVFIHPTGGVQRRPGLRFIDSIYGNGRLVSFEFNTEQVYLLAFTDRRVEIFRNDARVAEFATPWTLEHIAQLNWTQSADTLLVVHADVPPKRITRRGDSLWELADWSFVHEENRIHWPHLKFSNDEVTLTPSARNNSISITASAPVFMDEHIGVRFRIADREVQVTGVQSSTLATADVKEELSSTNTSKNWTEQAFSAARGWPTSVCFHQDRLVIGGSRDFPHRLWLSKSGDLFNFSVGTGLDDEAIEFSILSDQVNAIRNVFSGRHLQVFTSGAEWMVTGEPLTPTSIQLRRQTRVGSRVDRTVPPRDVDGATLFIPRLGPQVREFLFTDTEQAYQSRDLALLAHHLIKNPVDMDYDKSSRLLHVVMDDGSMATLTAYRDEQVSAWTLQETNGLFRSVATLGDRTYVLVERPGGYAVEVFDEALAVDSGLQGASPTPKSTWSGLTHLEGETVKVLADASAQSDEVVEAGKVTLTQPATTVQIGLPFDHVIEPLPVAVSSGAGAQGMKLRPIAVTFRCWETTTLNLDTGSGLIEVPFKRFGRTSLDAPLELFSGDKTIRALGWREADDRGLWRIEQNTPHPFTILSVTTHFSVNG